MIEDKSEYPILVEDTNELLTLACYRLREVSEGGDCAVERHEAGKALDALAVVATSRVDHETSGELKCTCACSGCGERQAEQDAGLLHLDGVVDSRDVLSDRARHVFNVLTEAHDELADGFERAVLSKVLRELSELPAYWKELEEEADGGD